ncbi:MG2 domain-containing protein [Flavobacteriaceae bacterium F08102]|nr:MG2 domain-containing protein [Flavobacteriaceae bacterium F08102]
MSKKIQIVTMLILFSTQINAQNNYDFDKHWRVVEQFEIKNLPKSALAEVNKIYHAAVKNKETVQLVKALIYQSKFALMVTEDAQYQVILNLKAEIEKASFPTTNILESMVADLYWQYYQQNRWKFYNRTETSEKVDSVDFRTWDLQTIFKETHRHYQNSLRNALELQETDLAQFYLLLDQVKDSKLFRPTLYDFLAHRALDFYRNDEQNLKRPSYKFEIDQPALLGTTTDFVRTPLVAKDSLSQRLHALKLYKNLSLFHLRDKHPRALVMNELNRLEFVRTYAVFEDKEAIYHKTLVHLSKKYKKSEIGTEIDFALASFLYDQGMEYETTKEGDNKWKLVEAINICEAAIERFPTTSGAQKCRHLIAQIKRPYLELKTEKFSPVQRYAKTLVTYKNEQQLYFKALDLSDSAYKKFKELHHDSAQVAFIKKMKVLTSWSQTLRDDKDFQKHQTEISIPPLPSGRKMIVVSNVENFDEDDTFAYSFIQITDLALIEDVVGAKYRYQVVDRITGEPRSNAKVRIQNFKTGRYNAFIDKTLITDKLGYVNFSVDRWHNYVQVMVSYGRDRAVFGDVYLQKQQQTRNQVTKRSAIFLFADRSIYRPGQKFYFKGIAVNSRNNQGNAIANKAVQVKLQDVHGQVVETLALTTNEYGSFSGEFILPNTGLTGNFYLAATLGKINGSMSFAVEEYKRPKFETHFNPVEGVFKLNDTVTVKGTATAFAGSMITDAKVSYRVVRNARFPDWYWRSRSFRVPSQGMEITKGETLTDGEGNFEINFKAIPDPHISEDSQPTFSYQVFADITDLNGETRSAQTTVNVGYHTMNLTVGVDDEVNRLEKDVTLTINTRNLNGQFVGATGDLQIYKLKTPGRVVRKRPWPAPDFQEMSLAEYMAKFPYEAYLNEDNSHAWEPGEMVYKTQFDTDKSTEIVLSSIKKWKLGAYLIKLTSSDAWGQEVKSVRYINVFDPKAMTVADHQLFEIKQDKTIYKPGEKVKISLGTAARELYVTIRVEKDHKTVKTEVIKLSEEIKTVEIPVTTDDVGGFTVYYQWVGINDYRSGSLNIPVPYPPHNLKMETTTFRNKLLPGQDETWSFKISGPKKDKVGAELLASMYDASLDQFRPHNWRFNPIYQQYYYGYNRSQASRSFGTVNFNVHERDYTYFPMPYQGYDKLKWFGLDFNNPSWVQRQYVANLKRERKTYDRVISGVVRDESGPLPGVSVMIKGTQYGTQTDFDGKYSLKVKDNDQLVFSYVGMKSVEVTSSSGSTINVMLEEDASSLDEVVVVGYGNSRDGKLHAKSMVNVEGEELAEMVAEDSAGRALEGKVAGVLVKNDGTPNDSVQSTVTQIPTADLSGIVARKNLEETAFFYPHLQTDSKGNISFSFTVPESLTKWNLNLLAHTKDMAVGQLKLTAVTQKDLMVMPNAPRFFREGDRIIFSSKVANLSEKALSGFIELQLYDALTNTPIDVKLGNDTKQQTFRVDAKGNTQVHWALSIPEGIQAVTYRVVAKTDDFSDGEENAVPVLSNRMLVTETLPMWIRSNQTKTFSLDKLKNTTSTTLKNHKLTLEVTSNPAWYAVQALPYLMEYPYECAEQTFSRYYANILASHIVHMNPRIQAVFDQWASSDALLSNLEKNEELKSLLIQETPWLRDAQSETAQKKQIALLFDLNKMKRELNVTVRKLSQMQFSNGGFPWFKGAKYPNRFITQYIASGFGHLNKLGIPASTEDQPMIEKAVRFLDGEIERDYAALLKEVDRIKKSAKTKAAGEKAANVYMASNHLGRYQIQYLYMRSFYPALAIPKSTEAAVAYYTQQAYMFWQDYNLYTKGMIALVAHRNNHVSAKAIVKSLKENAVENEELGMYWKENQGGWYWYESKIETQALMIEVFSEITQDQKTVDELKVWLLKNKQTNRWSSTKATSEAVYALLLQGTDWLEVTEFVGVEIGNKTIDPFEVEDSKVEAGTGYFKTSWTGSEINPTMAEVTLKKKGEGIAWGGLYWQYFEDLDKITPAKTPLHLTKKLFKIENTDRGEVLTAIDKVKLALGDKVRVRIELKVDRDMEFIHMKDMRAAGFEPVNVLSRYKWQDGLGYYQSTKDAATNFFIDYLPKGIYVFEYDLIVNNKGDFSNGITTIQNMYAPEFSSHSEGVRVKID